MPEMTSLSTKEVHKLNQALERIDHGVSVFRRSGHPFKPSQKKWDNDGIVGTRLGSYYIHTRSEWLTQP